MLYTLLLDAYENVTEDMDYILRVYKDFKKEYEKGNLEL